MDYSLHPACLEDLHIILPWVGTAELLRQWGGPSLAFPATPESVWSAIGAAPGNAFSLLDSSGELLGFGQAVVRDPSVHLARLIVSPSRRGQGLGGILAMKLIQAALTHHPDGITLKAYSDQAPALSLFDSLTFAAMPMVQRAESFTSLQPA
jgi:ribosomal protein S18 acetylase RimI-like enzyme